LRLESSELSAAPSLARTHYVKEVVHQSGAAVGAKKVVSELIRTIGKVLAKTVDSKM